MKENKLIVKIQKPVDFVFVYTITPINTSKWIKNIETEESNEWPIRIGTIYRNKDYEGVQSEYSVKEIKRNQLFELISKDGNYHVRYTYKPIDRQTMELEYFEWVDHGNLTDPFTQDVLENLKSVIEKK